MALSKSIDTDSGAAATYWRIVGGSYDLVSNTFQYVLAGYVDEAARIAGKAPLKQMAFQLSLGEGVTPESLSRSTLYTRTKTFVPFNGAPAPFDGAVDV